MWMVVPPIFTVDIPVGPSKIILDFSVPLQWKQFVWYGVVYNEIYLYLHCLKETCRSVQHYDNDILYNPWPVYEHWRLPFTLGLRNFYLLWFHDLAKFVPWSWEVQKFCFFFFILNHFHWNILPLVFYHFQSGHVGLYY